MLIGTLFIPPVGIWLSRAASQFLILADPDNCALCHGRSEILTAAYLECLVVSGIVCLSKLYRYLKPKSHIIGIKFFNRKEEIEGLGKGFRPPRKNLQYAGY